MHNVSLNLSIVQNSTTFQSLLAQSEEENVIFPQLGCTEYR